MAASHNTPPLQLPKITIDANNNKDPKVKNKSRADMYSTKTRPSGFTNAHRHFKDPMRNKSFIEGNNISRKVLMMSKLEAYKNAGNELRHKSVERQELFDRHFSNIVLFSVYWHNLDADEQ